MSLSCSTLLAHAIGAQTTQLEWILHSQNSVGSLLVLLSAALLFSGTLYLLKTRRPASVLAAYLVLLPLPCLLSICGAIKGTAASLQVIAVSPDLAVTRADWAGGVATWLTGLLIAMLVSAPSYALIAYGLLSRTIRPLSAAPQSISSRVTPPETMRGVVSSATS